MATARIAPQIEVRPIRLKNILIATDFSDAAARAVPCVRTLARQYKSEIHICHILDAFAHDDTEVGNRSDISLKKAEFKLAEWCQTNGLKEGEYEALLVFGEP